MVGIVRPGDGFIVNENFFLLATAAACTVLTSGRGYHEADLLTQPRMTVETCGWLGWMWRSL